MTNELYHYGVIGMKWGVRRYQNKDGSLTALGRRHEQRIDKIDLRRQSKGKEPMTLAKKEKLQNTFARIDRDSRIAVGATIVAAILAKNGTKIIPKVIAAPIMRVVNHLLGRSPVMKMPVDKIGRGTIAGATAYGHVGRRVIAIGDFRGMKGRIK